MPGTSGIWELTDHERIWYTPHGELMAKVKERYYGLRSQVRIGLVDAMGRVHHYDASELETQETRQRGMVVHVP